MRVALHTCCGPCASACVPALRALKDEPVLIFSNDNIDCEEEFLLRLENAQRLAQAEGVELFSTPYNHEEWLEKVAKGYENEPEKGARCERCFRYNLEKTAKFAKEHGLDAFTTSLTVSPHKVSPVIFKCGEEVALDNTPFLKVDFKKNNGFLCSTKRAKELNLYRQSYCGCEFSKKHLDKKP